MTIDNTLMIILYIYADCSYIPILHDIIVRKNYGLFHPAIVLNIFQYWCPYNQMGNVYLNNYYESLVGHFKLFSMNVSILYRHELYIYYHIYRNLL